MISRLSPSGSNYDLLKKWDIARDFVKVCIFVGTSVVGVTHVVDSITADLSTLKEQATMEAMKLSALTDRMALVSMRLDTLEKHEKEK